MRSRRVQVIACIALLAAVGGLLGLNSDNSPRLPGRIHFVCVQTGHRFEIDRAKVGIAIPRMNPKTKTATLLPCEVRDGQWFVGARYRAALQQLAEVNKFVDPETLQVRG